MTKNDKENGRKKGKCEKKTIDKMSIIKYYKKHGKIIIVKRIKGPHLRLIVGIWNEKEGKIENLIINPVERKLLKTLEIALKGSEDVFSAQIKNTQKQTEVETEIFITTLQEKIQQTKRLMERKEKEAKKEALKKLIGRSKKWIE